MVAVVAIQTLTLGQASRTYQLITNCAGRRTGGTAGTAEDGGSYMFAGTYKNTAGAVAIVAGSPVSIYAQAVAAWTTPCTYGTPATNTVPVNCTTPANTNAHWMCSTEIKASASS